MSDEYQIGNISGKQGFVRGLHWEVNSVIGWDSKGHVYAATITENSHITFYTSNQAYRNSLPDFISDWYESFSDYSLEIVYKKL